MRGLQFWLRLIQLILNIMHQNLSSIISISPQPYSLGQYLFYNFRFDLIYLLLDKIDSNEDRHLANHIARLYSPNSDLNSCECLNRRDFHLYIKYGKSLNPKLTDEAMKKLAECYISMRKMNGTGGKTVIAATTRQLESLIRLSEAHARMR